MAAKIYSAPVEINLPENTFDNVKDWVKNDDDYIKELRSHLKTLGYIGKNVGEIIQFPVGDGYAQYMVVSMKPLRLIHLELGDAWCFRYANLLTAKEVQKKIDGAKALSRLFKK